MSLPAVEVFAEEKKSLDKFVSMAHNYEALMKFIQIANDSFERKGTIKITLHVKCGEPKGGDGQFSF